jgi:hypothetical protein
MMRAHTERGSRKDGAMRTAQLNVGARGGSALPEVKGGERHGS